MRYCGEHGIPHSWFLGGPFQWTDDDRDAAIAWQRFNDELCSNCHTRREDYFDEDGRLAIPPPFTVALRRCPGCQDTELYVRTERKKFGDNHDLADEKLAGVFPVLIPNPDWRPRKEVT